MAAEIVTNGNYESPEEKAAKAVAEGLDRLFRKLGSPTFPWLADLEEGERRDFYSELYTAMDNTRYGVPNPTSLDYARAIDEVVIPWKATAQAVRDGLPEILATATEGDFGPVPSPYKPRYELHSIICDKVQPGHYADRYRVMGFSGPDYVLRPLTSQYHVERLLWEAKDCDQHTRLEWLDDKPRLGRIAWKKPLRLLNDEETKRMEGWTDGQ